MYKMICIHDYIRIILYPFGIRIYVIYTFYVRCICMCVFVCVCERERERVCVFGIDTVHMLMFKILDVNMLIINMASIVVIVVYIFSCNWVFIFTTISLDTATSINLIEDCNLFLLY